MKAVETIYNGHTYRSATECAWALLLDLAGVEYTYEPQKIGRYWPDFQLRHNGLYLEIKARKATVEELEKASAIKGLVFLCGRPKPNWVNGSVQAMGWSAAEILGPDRVRYYQPRPDQANDTLSALLSVDCDFGKAASLFKSKWEDLRIESKAELDSGRIGIETVAASLAEAFGIEEQWTPRTHQNYA